MPQRSKPGRLHTATAGEQREPPPALSMRIATHMGDAHPCSGLCSQTATASHCAAPPVQQPPASPQHLVFLTNWQRHIAPRLQRLLELLAAEEVARALAVAQVRWRCRAGVAAERGCSLLWRFCMLCCCLLHSDGQRSTPALQSSCRPTLLQGAGQPAPAPAPHQPGPRQRPYPSIP